MRLNFDSIIQTKFRVGGWTDGRVVGRTESDCNANLWPPTDQLTLGLAQLIQSVVAECCIILNVNASPYRNY